MRNFANSLLSLEYELDGPAPVQALGTIAGRDFYFRSRHSEWSFEIANERGDLPSDVGEPVIFQRHGMYRNASYMPDEVATEIIEKCAIDFLRLGGA